jgi:hypothetical protein
MSRTYQTYTHELAPGLSLTVEIVAQGYTENGQYFPQDDLLEAAKLNACGIPVDLLEGMPYNRDPWLWLDKEQPERARLIDLCMSKGKVSERAMSEAEAA